MRMLLVVVVMLSPLAGAAQPLTGNDIVQVQGLLSDMGYRTSVDGVMGPGTAGVIRQFQVENGLPVTGEPSHELIGYLRALHAQGWNRGQVFAPGSVSPSFDCARASIPAEHAVCSDNELALLDRSLAEAYQTALARNGAAARDRVTADQRKWLQYRESCGGDRQCLHNSMTGQISILNGM